MDNQNNSPKQALLDRLQQSTNILVTVSANPSVDQLAACLGLTLWLNKIGKHGTAVFSGEVPSTLEFLQPADTLEKNTDSLRDFIIALDKTKADKLRYKVEDSVVKIFITPYRTSLTADDLEYSQGDFNVDMVIALGVAAQQDLDTAITAHGRILHDATVATVMTAATSELGSINWRDGSASSLSELIVDLGNGFGREHLDGQIATALLTGIVAETARFSNEKTTPQTMSVSAQLMAAGANQQLVASELEAPEPEKPAEESQTPTDETSNSDEQPPETDEAEPAKPNDGTLEIAHESETEEPQFDAPDSEAEQSDWQPAAAESALQNDQPTDEAPLPEPVSQEQSAEQPEAATPNLNQPPKMITEPPLLGGTLTANSRPDDIMLEPTSDPMSQVAEAEQPLMDREPLQLPPLPAEPTPADDQATPEAAAPTDQPLQPAPPSWMPQQAWLDPAADTATDQPLAADQPAQDASSAQPATMPLPAPVGDQPTDQPLLQPYAPDDTLTEIEEAVHSPHVEQPEADQPDLNSARDEVMQALNSVPDTNPAPVQALNAQPIELNAPALNQDPLPSVGSTGSTAFNPASFDTANDQYAATTPPTAALDTMQPAIPTIPPALDPELTGPVKQPFTMPLPAAMAPPAANPVPPTSSVTDPTAPPPVPPPLMPPTN